MDSAEKKSKQTLNLQWKKTGNDWKKNSLLQIHNS